MQDRKAAKKYIPNLKASGLDQKARNLVALLMEHPFQMPPTYEKVSTVGGEGI